MTLITLIAVFIWIMYDMCEGKVHAYYYAFQLNSSLKENFDAHPTFVLMRLAVFLPLWKITNWEIALSLFLMQPFFHNGNYYRNRNKLDGSYPLGWFDHSTTSIAKSTKYLTSKVRISMVIVSILIIIFKLLY